MERRNMVTVFRVLGISTMFAGLVALTPVASTMAAPGAAHAPSKSLYTYCVIKETSNTAIGGDAGDGNGGDANANGGNAQGGNSSTQGDGGNANGGDGGAGPRGEGNRGKRGDGPPFPPEYAGGCGALPG